jgi:biopolymer transport protein ExbB/TolQ
MQSSLSVGSGATLWSLFISGGFTMVPLLACSIIIWIVIVDRLIATFRLKSKLKDFHLQASNNLLKKDTLGLRRICNENIHLPTAYLTLIAIDQSERNPHWVQAIERQRLLFIQKIRGHVWLLGTIAAAAPFIGLLGTIIGILESFKSLSELSSGSNSFNVVSAGISEALIATAFGIIVAVIAVLAFNAFQNRFAQIILLVRIQMEEIIELLKDLNKPTPT